jgi:prevent-host-death family protein
MRDIAISDFKARCLAILEQVRRTKKPVRITRFGVPVAEVVPPSPVKGRADWIGSMKGKMEITGDILSPVIDEHEFEAMKD